MRALARRKQNGPEHLALMKAGLAKARERAMAGEGFIYVCGIEGSDAIKIGHSLDPLRRAMTHGPSMRLLGYFRASIDAERALHRMLKPRRHAEYEGREIYPRAALFHPAIPAPIEYARPKRRRTGDERRAA
jgi:hypothetical protein